MAKWPPTGSPCSAAQPIVLRSRSVSDMWITMWRQSEFLCADLYKVRVPVLVASWVGMTEAAFT